MTKPTTFTELANPYLRKVEPYIPGLTIREAMERYDIPPERIVKLSSNENPIGAPPLAVEAVRNMLDELHYYPDSKALELRSAIAAHEGLAPDTSSLERAPARPCPSSSAPFPGRETRWSPWIPPSRCMPNWP